MSLDRYCYELLVGKKKPSEQWARKGKPEWPHHVRVMIPKRRLLDLARQLIGMYQLWDDNDPNSGDLILHGELREDDDE